MIRLESFELLLVIDRVNVDFVVLIVSRVGLKEMTKENLMCVYLYFIFYFLFIQS